MSLAAALPWLGLGMLPLLAGIGRFAIESASERDLPSAAPPWQATAWDATRDAVLCAGLFLLLGPPVGTLTLWLGVLVFGDGGDGAGIPAREVLQAGLMMLPFGWIFGGVQAAVAGAVAGLLRPLGGSAVAYALVLAAALAASACMAFVLGLVHAQGGLGVVRLLMLPGLVATLACMRVLHRRG